MKILHEKDSQKYEIKFKNWLNSRILGQFVTEQVQMLIFLEMRH